MATNPDHRSTDEPTDKDASAPKTTDLTTAAASATDPTETVQPTAATAPAALVKDALTKDVPPKADAIKPDSTKDDALGTNTDKDQPLKEGAKAGASEATDSPAAKLKSDKTKPSDDSAPAQPVIPRSAQEIKADIDALNQYHPWVGMAWVLMGIAWVLAYITIDTMNAASNWLWVFGPLASAVGFWYFFYARGAREGLPELKEEYQEALIRETTIKPTAKDGASSARKARLEAALGSASSRPKGAAEGSASPVKDSDLPEQSTADDAPEVSVPSPTAIADLLAADAAGSPKASAFTAPPIKPPADLPKAQVPEPTKADGPGVGAAPEGTPSEAGAAAGPDDKADSAEPKLTSSWSERTLARLRGTPEESPTQWTPQVTEPTDSEPASSEPAETPAAGGGADKAGAPATEPPAGADPDSETDK
ncbi:MAG: hypothetical protein LBH68_06095 [Bifidobacteriaceae bacterium]|jgi:hypothetical protein|nr:hypothetical protein [Bifidobacteriaceae bacterium]